MRFFQWGLFLAAGVLFSCCNPSHRTDSTTQPRERWTTEQANDWYRGEGWLVGANYIPSTAINQLEMWQAASFDTVTIARELGWAQDLGMNVMRVYLHDLLHHTDSSGLYQRMSAFLSIAQQHHIKILFVLFDSCWDPFPHAGKQRAPRPHVHNSGWVQSPGQVALKDSTQYLRLERYVKGVVAHFASDERILAWDIWNEPDNMNEVAYGNVEMPNKVEYVLPLLKRAFRWARAAQPSQPLTTAIWKGDWSSDSMLRPIEQWQLNESDIVSFHNYGPPGDLEKRIRQLQRYNRPLICTEYMARPNGSTFQACLPVGKTHRVGMINWGFVSGKTQTIYPWDSWTTTYQDEPPVWFHDIYRKTGTPYRAAEVAFIKAMTTNGTH